MSQTKKGLLNLLANPKIPIYNKPRFNCPHCGAFSQIDWYDELVVRIKATGSGSIVNNTGAARCFSCGEIQFWDTNEKKMLYPQLYFTPPPNLDMPKDALADFEEARKVFGDSPRASCALLRLAVQKICIDLGGLGKNLNADIKKLVKKGLAQKTQQAFDLVRIVGNNSVHPGKIDVNDTPEIAVALFELVNMIVDQTISQPTQIDEMYKKVVPDKDKRNIEKRDASNKTTP